MFDNIRLLIGQSRTREALEALTEFLRSRDRNLFDECFGQLGRFNHISQESRKNVISFDDYNRELNRINFALLDMLQQAERQFESELLKKTRDTEGVVNRQSTFEYDVFLSFSSKEKEAAFIAFEHLTQAGIKTFFSSESLKKYSGQSFSKVINNALENSQHFILFCSPNAMQSNWVELEWETFFNEFHVKDSNNRRFFILKGHDFQNASLPLILKRIQ